MLLTRGAVLVALAGLLAACAEEARLPNLEQIYQRTAEIGENGPERRPLITVPGTLGSRLIDSASGRVIWGGSGSRGISADPDDPEEYQLIALPVAVGDEPLTELNDTVVSAGILETAEAEVLGIPIDVNVYGEALGVLTAGGFSVDRRASTFRNDVIADADDLRSAQFAVAADPEPAPKTQEPLEVPEAVSEFDSFQFDYDWRRDLIETAHRFGDFLERKRREVASARGVPPSMVRFDLLAHSMGGLVSRYFLMYGKAEPNADGTLPPITWAGADYFSRVVFVAPPNAGSIIAMDNLINGKELGPLQPVYSAAMLGTHPAAYQLTPRSRHRGHRSSRARPRRYPSRPRRAAAGRAPSRGSGRRALPG